MREGKPIEDLDFYDLLDLLDSASSWLDEDAPAVLSSEIADVLRYYRASAQR